MSKSRIVITSVIVFISIFIFVPVGESRCEGFSTGIYENPFSPGFFPDYGYFSQLNQCYDAEKEFSDYIYLSTKIYDHHIHHLIRYFISKKTYPLLTIVCSSPSSRSPPFLNLTLLIIDYLS